MKRLGQPAGDSRRGLSLLEEILYIVAFSVLLYFGLSILTGGFGSARELASFAAVLFLVIGAYGASLKILTLLDVLFPPNQPGAAHPAR